MKTKCPDCCYPEVFDSDACGCCEGVEAVTPLPTANRPGLSKLSYRIGTHADLSRDHEGAAVERRFSGARRL